LLATPALAIISIDYVTVGNAGNAGNGSYGAGAVDYEYKIARTEVTNAEYVQFLNTKGASNDYEIYNSAMADYGIRQNGSSGSFTYSVTGALANRPVVYVSWFDAARFAS
jgi:sulfatase modifying factor 1